MNIPFGSRYYRPIGALTNTVSWVDLTSSNFDFARARPDGSDLRVYDATADAQPPYWLLDYDPAAKSGRLYFRASNVAHQHRLYYGDATASSASNFAAVFTHGTGFDAGFGDMTTLVAGSGYASQVPASTGVNDARNYRVWSIAELPTLQYSDTGLGGTYTGVREMSLVRDAVTNLPIQVGGRYYITFARRSAVPSDKFDCAIASSTSQYGPWSNFSVFYTAPGTIRLCYPSTVLRVGSTYVCYITYGWDTGGSATPGITVYVMTSADLVTWTAPVKALDSSIWTDYATGLPCTDNGNPWVIRCSDGVYMLVVEAERAGSGRSFNNYGAVATDPINGPWTACNSGNALLHYSAGGWDDSAVANPKIFQQQDGTYVMPLNGQHDPVNSNWQLGFATSATRDGPYTDLSYNPVGGRFTDSYGFETSSFHLDVDGATLLNYSQRYGDSGTGSTTARIYRLGALKRQGGLLVSPATTDASAAGCVLAPGTFTAESRSILTAHRATAATPLLLSLYDYASVPAAGPGSGFDAASRVKIFRWSHDYDPATTTSGRGDITFQYFDPGGVAHYWNGTAWSTSTAGRNLSADHGREVVARLGDDGTNFVLSATYADDGSSIASASIAKSSVGAFASGRTVIVGDPFTDSWGGGMFLRCLAVRPYAASDPTISLGAAVAEGGLISPSYRGGLGDPFGGPTGGISG